MVSLLNGTEFFTELSMCLLNIDTKSTLFSNRSIIKYIATGTLTVTSAILLYEAIQAGRKRITQILKQRSIPCPLTAHSDPKKAVIIAEIALRILVDIKQMEPGTALLNIVLAMTRKKGVIIRTH